MNNPIVQLSNVQTKQLQFTVLETPIWRAKLWIVPYLSELPFMTGTGTNTSYNTHAIVLDNVIIDFVPFLKIPNNLDNSMEILRATEKSWMIDPNVQDGSVLLIHFENHYPPFSFLNIKTGEVIGFSYKNVIKLGNQKLYPLLLDFPQVEDNSDILSYGKMSFATGNVTIDNSAGMLDELFELFGNDITLLNYSKDKLETIRQFFIESYEIGLDKVSFSVKDKRSRLTFKAPNTFYTREEFPHIAPENEDEDENKQTSTLINKVIQDAYGLCFNIPGTCINRYDLYEIEPNLATNEEGKFNNDFQFKFAREITRIDEVWVEMSDVWTQVYPMLGIPGNFDPDSNNLNKYRPNPHPIKIMTEDSYGNFTNPIIYDNYKTIPNKPKNNGVIIIHWSQAIKDNPGHLGNRNGDANKVKMTGVFVDLHTPGDIIKDLMVYYGNLPYSESYFDLADWDKEMSGIGNIGVCLDKQEDIYNWIEKIQNGSLIGFQLLIYRNLFSARVDNSNREESFNIKWSEILNRESLVSEMNGEFYATFASIKYARDVTEDEYRTVIDKSKRIDILDIYKFEKEYENESFLTNKGDAEQKAAIILENFMQVHPIIRNIELAGLRWVDIKLFSTGFIDLTVELPRNMKAIQIYMKKRRFIGKLRVKVINCKRDLKEDKTYIDVIQCDYNMKMPLHFLPFPLDISGEYPGTIDYLYEFDGGNPATKDDEYVYELDGREVNQ